MAGLSYWTAFWAAWAAAGLIAEAIALYRGRDGETLTWHLRALLRRRWLWLAGLALSIWAVGHVFFGLE